MAEHELVFESLWTPYSARTWLRAGTRPAAPLVAYLVSLVGFWKLPVERLLAKVGKVAERELGPIGH